MYQASTHATLHVFITRRMTKSRLGSNCVNCSLKQFVCFVVFFRGRAGDSSFGRDHFTRNHTPKHPGSHAPMGTIWHSHPNHTLTFTWIWPERIFNPLCVISSLKASLCLELIRFPFVLPCVYKSIVYTDRNNLYTVMPRLSRELDRRPTGDRWKSAI